MADDKTFTKEDVDAAIAKAVAAVQESVDRLEKKNEELIGENRKLKRGAEIKPEDLQAAEDRADKAEAALKDAQKLAKDATGAKEKLEKALKDEQGVTQKLLVENGLKDALTANGVTHSVHQKAAAALLSGQVQIIAEGDTRVAKVGDKNLSDFVKEWAGGDEGKHFVSAPTNSGGGSQGGGKANSATVKTMTRSAYSALDQNAKAELGQQMAKGELKIVDEAA